MIIDLFAPLLMIGAFTAEGVLFNRTGFLLAAATCLVCIGFDVYETAERRHAAREDARAD